jgi:hypothetical protein
MPPITEGLAQGLRREESGQRKMGGEDKRKMKGGCGAWELRRVF